ncbi:PA3496 family putative envelope integrity protein [Stutzerimonas azotifigens]|uniref:Transcriptional regulator n=1 Tax=Stutzerimonas azotifigens TaxID=291995 RepID=A0ABR5Z429_9GAMM|nr:transcriptional regulator [Stutzerimonas azotifigens]MBA1274907.1 transcriptional regulator [Stutzerimonas azotifigens]
MHSSNDYTATLDSKGRRKLQDERRMRYRRAIELYAEQRRLQAELVDDLDELLAGHGRRVA